MTFNRRRQRGPPVYAGLAAAATALLLAIPPRAGGTTAVLAVTATVNPNCTISASAVSFGRYESLQANATTPLNATGAVSIACTKGSAPRITMDLGRNPNGGRRYMALATGGGGGAVDALNYELYQPASAMPGAACSFPGAVVWGPSAAQTFVPNPSLNRASRTYSVCGTIPAGQGVTMGSYADTVVATVNF
jgi:spore coat protein U-like protein